MKGVVLLSGGLDSAVTAWIAKQECEELSVLIFQYGQRHQDREVGCALMLAEELRVKRQNILTLPIYAICGSALTSKEADIPTEGLIEGIPVTWVPQRNSIFLAFAFGWAETLGYDSVWIGANAVDYSGYPDCRPEFMQRMEEALNDASKRFIERFFRTVLRYPVIRMTKAEEITIGMELGVPFEKTTSCYLGGEKACGLCGSCLLRLKAFAEAGLEDPIEYEEVK